MKRSIPPWRCSGADCPERRIVNGGRGGVDCPHLVKACRCDRLAPVEIRMSLWCPLCDVPVVGFGRRQTIGRMAQHLAVEHPSLRAR